MPSKKLDCETDAPSITIDSDPIRFRFLHYFSADWVRLRFTQIASQEATHVSFLTAALTGAGAKPVAACKYNFNITTPESYRALSQVLEGVGVAAYLGAAPYIQSKAYLGVAGS